MTQTVTDTGILAGDERMLIAGELQHTASGALFDVEHPGNGQVVGQATDGTVDDMDRAIATARKAFETTDWSRDVAFRHHCLLQLRDALKRNKERLRRIVVTEVGCPISVTSSQIEDPIEEVKHWAEYGRNFEYLRDTGIHKAVMGTARRALSFRLADVDPNSRVAQEEIFGLASR